VVLSLLVIYTERREECRTWYAGLGLEFVREKHGDGPEHDAATLADGCVLELYPAGTRGATGRIRLGLTLPARAHGREPGRYLLTDPDGRTVDLTVTAAED
jgi:catechol 2,3-dioxygenase-like lactoylglutathione lyase family enzyme